MAHDTTNYLETKVDVDADFILTNRAGFVDDKLQNRNVQGRWGLETNGGTTSGGTGASANPAGRSAYIYAESSGNQASSAWAIQRRLPFDSIGQTYKLDILLNLNIQTITTLYVEYATIASPNETTDWTTLTSFMGTGIDAWIPYTFDFSLIQSNTLRVRIRMDCGTSFENDFCLSTWREYGESRSVLDQEGFRFRNDDGSEIGATWKQPQDTNIIIDTNSKVRLRTLIDAEGNANTSLTLQYKRKDEPDSEWRTI